MIVTNLADAKNLQTRVHHAFTPWFIPILKQPQIQQFLHPGKDDNNETVKLF